MSLDEYRRKRNFDRTTEPAAGGRRRRRAGAALRFVVQKHAARRLHYDFRLELDGVLKSWAVPKGPSPDPADRRLAVRTEDHPLDYAGFEGVIPAGQYGGGTVLLWDQGIWTPLDDDPAAALAAGRLHFELEGARLGGRWTLVRKGGRGAAGAGDEAWFLIKGRDDFARAGADAALPGDEVESVASGRTMDAIAADPARVWTGKEDPPARPRQRRAKAPAVGRGMLRGAPKGALPDRPKPLLATLAKAAPAGDGWVHEIKYDGYRILARLDNGVALQTRNGHDWAARFPEIAAALRRLPAKAALIDGEIVRFEPSGQTSFGGLQQALSTGRTGDLTYQAFDLLHLDGVDLRPLPLTRRKAILRRLLEAAPDPRLGYSDHVASSGPEVHGKACTFGLEGIVSKRADAPYSSGRSPDWRKIKCENREEFVIVGFTEPAGSREGFGALLLGYHDRGGTLRYAGRCGTGFDRATLGDLRRRLDRLARKTPPVEGVPSGAAADAVTWVSPRLVAEIRYAEWTADGLLRQSRFLGLREDKPADQVVRDRPGETGQEEVPPPRRAAARSPAAGEDGADGRPQIAGVVLTHPDRIFYRPDGITKLDLARYYQAVAPEALRHMAGRVLSLVRCPEGLGEACFFQKHEMRGFPPEIRRLEIEEKGRRQTYLHIDDLSGLVGLVQMGVLEIHVWGSTVDAPDRPDRIIFDLDPDEGLPWERVQAAAIELRDALAGIGLGSVAKTTGGKGLHVVVPIRPELGWEEVKDFARAVADSTARAAPDRYTASIAKKARAGRIFIDYLRNAHGATAVAAFSTRARPGAPVAVPVSWQEVERGVRSDAFTVASVPDRLRTLKADPWDGVDTDQRLAPILKKITA